MFCVTDVINGDKSVDVGQCAVQCDSSDASANDQSQPITVVSHSLNILYM